MVLRVLVLALVMVFSANVYAQDKKEEKPEFKIERVIYFEGKKCFRIRQGTVNGIEFTDIREVYKDEQDQERYTKSGAMYTAQQKRTMEKYTLIEKKWIQPDQQRERYQNSAWYKTVLSRYVDRNNKLVWRGEFYELK
jgi:lipopolysaccharide export LptBFGC system permease protein LptF